MSMPVISIIVPVYNAAKYLGKCLDSIQAQTYTSLEILLIDDGSTDESLAICEEYARKDSRFRVIHQENQGVSAARNKGLDLASGDFIGFVDSDDWIEPDMYELLYKNLCEADADVSTCSHTRATIKKDAEPRTYIFNQTEAMNAALGAELNNRFVGIYFWNKLYKKEVFNSVRCPVGMIYEDVYIILDLLGNVKKMVSTNELKYYYRETPESITTKKYIPRDEDRVIASLKNLKLAKSKYPEVVYAARIRYVSAHCTCLTKILYDSPHKHLKQAFRHGWVLIKNAGFILFKCPELSIVHLIARRIRKIIASKLKRNKNK